LEYLLQFVKDNVYAFAVWDSTWNSYNNCYIVLESDGVTLIDSGKRVHANHLANALQSLGKKPDDVTLFIATHGHKDHVEGVELFKQAKRFIHSRDEGMITDSNQFSFVNGESGDIANFHYSLVGTHTPGSIVIYHRPSKILFSGDLICYFGDPLSKDGFVSEGLDLREAWLAFLKGGGIAPEELEPFLNGLQIMENYEAEALCTGHGGVLVGQIPQFINDLLHSAKQ